MFRMQSAVGVEVNEEFSLLDIIVYEEEVTCLWGGSLRTLTSETYNAFSFKKRVCSPSFLYFTLHLFLTIELGNMAVY